MTDTLTQRVAEAILPLIEDDLTLTTPPLYLLRIAQAAIAAMPARDVWQPIDTAPKDGLPILAYNPTGRMVGASFHIAWFSPDEMAGGGVWHNSRGAIGYHSNRTNRREGDLTHWMPLPPSPGESPAVQVGDVTPPNEHVKTLVEALRKIRETHADNQSPALNMPDADYCRRIIRDMHRIAKEALASLPPELKEGV